MPGMAAVPGARDLERLGDEGGAEHGLELPVVIGEDVGVVHAHVERDRAGLAEVAPGADDDGVVATDVCLDHEVHLAEQAVVEHGPGKAVRTVPPVVLRHRQDRTRARGGIAGSPGRP